MQSNPKVEKEVESVKDKENNDIFLEDSIEQLNKYLSDLKKDRQRTEKDEKLLNYRNKVLNMEENKVAKKLENVQKHQEKKEKIRVNINHDKKIMQEKKKNDLINLERQRTKNSTIKSEIDKSLKNWKINLSKKNKDEADKIKKERNQIRSLINETKERNNNFNREMHDSVQLGHLQVAEQKRMEEYQKKLLLKREIEEEIQKELALKNQLEERINVHQKKNREIADRIKNFHVINPKSSQRNFYRKSKTPKNPKKIHSAKNIKKK